MWVCFLKLNKDLTGEEGLEGGLLACGTAGSWQQQSGGREACWRFCSLKLLEDATINKCCSSRSSWSWAVGRDPSAGRFSSHVRLNSVLLLLHSFQTLGEKTSHLFCALAFASNIWFTETEPFQPHKLTQFLASEALKAGILLPMNTQGPRLPQWHSYSRKHYTLPIPGWAINTYNPQSILRHLALILRKKRWHMIGWLWALAQDEIPVCRRKWVSTGDFIFWADRPDHFWGDQCGRGSGGKIHMAKEELLRRKDRERETRKRCREWEKTPIPSTCQL